MSGWQPIETAPRDGTRIVGWCPLCAHGPEARVVWSKSNGKGWRSQPGWWDSRPTHWMAIEPEQPPKVYMTIERKDGTS